MADYGFKIAETGYDVVTADDDKLVYSSKFPGWKILAQGTFTINVVAGSTWYTTTISGLTSGGIGLAWLDRNPAGVQRRRMPHNTGVSSTSQLRIKSTSMDLMMLVGGATGLYTGYYYWIARS